MKPSVSVIICTKDRPEELQRCLDSIAQQIILPDEVVVVDASTNSPTSLLSTIKKSLKGVRFHRVASPPGLTRQRNVGIKDSTGEIIFFFDDDTVLDPHYIEACLTIYETYPQCGGVTGKIVEDKNPSPISQVINYMAQLPYFSTSGRLRLSGHHTDPRYGQKIRGGLEFMSGCCMSFRRHILEAIGGFDEELETYCLMEDVDASYRASRVAPLYFTPQATLRHYESPHNRLKAGKLAEMAIKNQSYLFNKNLPPTLLRRMALAWSIICVMAFALLKADRARFNGYLTALRRP